MKKKIIFTALLISLTTLGATQLEVSSVDIDPDSPRVGDEVEISASSDTYGVDYLQAKYPGHSSEWDSRDCSTDLYGCDTSDTEGGSWAFTPDSSGDYNVEVRARDGLDTSTVIERTVSVEGSSESNLELKSVSSTKNTLSEGQSTTLKAEVKNSGDSSEYVNVEWFAGDNRLSSAGGGVSPDSAQDFERTISYSDLRDSGMDVGTTYDLSAQITGTNKEVVSGTLKLESSEEDARFEVGITETNSPVNTGENLDVDYIIENTGGKYDVQDVELFIDGEKAGEDRARGLGTGNSMTGTLSWSTSGSDEGEHTVSVETEDDSDSSSVRVQHASGSVATLSFTSISASQYEIEQDDSITLQATVENDRDESKWVNVEWFAGDNRIGTAGKSISSEGSEILERTRSYQDLIGSGLSADQDYELKAVITGEDVSYSSGRSLTLASLSPKEPEFQVEVTGTDSPVDEGETLQVDYEIENTGNDFGTQDVTLSIDGEQVDVDSNRGLGTGNSMDGTLEWETSDLDAGSYDAVVGTDDDSDQVSVQVDAIGDNQEDPVADLDVSTVSGSSTYERVELDASGSSDADGHIERYKFDVDGDGYYEKTDYGNGIVENSYYSDFSGYVKVKVYDNDGNTDTDREYVNIDLDDDDDYNERPEAEFDYNPSSLHIDQEVEFDASSSSDDESIVDYSWSFGDGESNSGREVSHKYDSEGTYPVSLTVEDDDGNEDTRTRYVDVSMEQGACGISQSSFSFSLDDYVIYDDESTDAELNVYNAGTRDQGVEVVFKVDSDVVDSRTVEVGAGESRKVTESVSPDRDSLITAQVSAKGSPCGSKVFDDLRKELIVLSGSGQKDAATLEVNVDSDDGDVRGARVEVDGPEDRVRYTDRYGDAGFRLESGDYDVEVSHPDYETEEESVDLEAGESEDLDFYLDRDDDGEGTLEVNVVDEGGDDIEDARVRVENGDTEVERTNYRGFASFGLHPDNYDIEVSHPDYDDVARSSVNIERGEVDSRTLTLYDDERDGIEIVSTDYSSSVCRGSTLSVDVKVRNDADRDEYVDIVGSGLGKVVIIDGFVLEEGETQKRRIRFTNVEGSGTEELKIRAKNGTSDRVYRDVEVEDCDISAPDRPERDPSSVSMKLSYPISPNKALVGDTVKVSGFVDGVNRRSEVEIDVNGERKARVSTEPDGYYQTYIRVDSTGIKTVTARSGGEYASREIEVLPTASVGLVEAPRKVFEGETFEVCSEVNSQVEAKVLLLEDGRILDSTNANGEVCFDVDASDVGRHTYEVRALTSGEGSSSTTSVEVLETDVEAKSFPDQVASVESGSGMVKVELYNTDRSTTRYDVDLEGLPSTWTSQTEKQVVLSSGERKTVYFYLTPREEGNYDPEVIVNADNQEVFRQKVDLYTGGQTEPRKSSFLAKLTGLFGL